MIRIMITMRNLFSQTLRYSPCIQHLREFGSAYQGLRSTRLCHWWLELEIQNPNFIVNLDLRVGMRLLVSLLVAKIQVFAWAFLVFWYFVSETMPVSIKFNKNAWSLFCILSISSIRLMFKYVINHPCFCAVASVRLSMPNLLT